MKRFFKIAWGIEEGRCWLVHEMQSFFLDHMDVSLFKSITEAIRAFAEPIREGKFRVFYVPTIQDALRQIHYGNPKKTLYHLKNHLL
jgi:isochorismate hydrolase